MGRIGAVVLLAMLLSACTGPVSPSLSPGPASAGADAATQPLPGTSLLVGPSPAPSLSSPVPASVTPTPATAWHRLGSIPRSVDEVVGFLNGYVALDSEGGSVAYSEDGASWRSVALPMPGSAGRDANGRLGRALTTNGIDVLVVGGDGDQPVAWISSDGLTWRRAGPVEAPAGSEFVAAWPIVGGWEAALSSWAGVDLGGQTIWRTSDGISWWESFHESPVVWEGYDRVPLPVVDPSARVLLVASNRDRPDAALVAAAIGGPWTVLDGFPVQGASVRAGSGPQEGPGGWVLAGYTSVDNRSFTPTIWRSDDLVRWTAIALPVGRDQPGPWLDTTGMWVSGLAASADGYVAVGANAGADEATHETWVSPDGSSWRLLASASRPTLDFGPRLVAMGPLGALGISPDPKDPEHSSAAWQLR